MLVLPGSEEKRQREGGGGWVYRKMLSGSGLFANCNLCKRGALLITADLPALCSGYMTALIKSAVLVLDALVNTDGQPIPQNPTGQHVETVLDDTHKAFYIKQRMTFKSVFFPASMHVYSSAMFESMFLISV